MIKYSSWKCFIHCSILIFPSKIKKIIVKNSDKNVHGVYVKGGNLRNACRSYVNAINA